MAAQEAQQAGDDPTGLALVPGAMGRPMRRDWSPAEQYQAIALLGAIVVVLSEVTGKSEEESLTELESNYHESIPCPRDRAPLRGETAGHRSALA